MYNKKYKVKYVLNKKKFLKENLTIFYMNFFQK